jgi:S1-C subfamily serine protease
VLNVRRIVLIAAVALVAALGSGAAMTGAARGSTSTEVVEIATRLAYANGVGEATGMVLTSSGEVLTNNHVIRGATLIRVHVPGGRTYSARVLGYDISADIALLKLRGASGLRTVSLGDSSKVRLGQKVTAIGNEGGTGVLTTKTGTVTALGRTITVNDEQGGTARLTRLIKTDADLRPGDSGGPLLDSSGRVIGMNAAASAELVYQGSGGDGFAIPVNRARSIATQIEAGRSSASVHVGATPFLGVRVEGRSSGVLVTNVTPGSPAARGGIRPGDIIVAVGGHIVRTHAGLVAFLLRKHPGDRIRVTWVDDFGNRSFATVTLASGPPQ